ncbi:hypothetical protein BV898_00559 [Hypsibius exemplaris]|uniref:Uncharacterized protein n=1 Tax=Hypsibius exemplaris TaxID=2072580 RepID=A0A1W0XDT7_HYPEX|nr:hypothetical protein BV898_00559 [Hypsibius exemplaris]
MNCLVMFCVLLLCLGVTVGAATKDKVQALRTENGLSGVAAVVNPVPSDTVKLASNMRTKPMSGKAEWLSDVQNEFKRMSREVAGLISELKFKRISGKAGLRSSSNIDSSE